MKLENISGPSIDPYGTPHKTAFDDPIVYSVETLLP